jgi:CBS domain-containing protein
MGLVFMRVRELMRTDVPTARIDTNIREVARLLTEFNTSIPVVDDQQRLIGVVRETDLFLKEKGIPFTAVKMPALFERWVDPKQLHSIYLDISHHTAGDVMTVDFVTVEPEESIGHAAWLLLKHGISAIPVVEEGRLVGVLSQLDFIRLLADTEN